MPLASTAPIEGAAYSSPTPCVPTFRIKEILGFRQFSLRGNWPPLASGVWSVWRSL
jgi:hypothetical protein